MTSSSLPTQVKVVLLGDSGVGKSSIMLRFVTGSFSEESEPTLGGAFMAKLFPYKDKSFKYQIWDTAGQEKYQSLAPMYFRDAQVAILIYDVTKRSSFDSLQKWTHQLKEFGPSNIMLVVVGNKIDLSPLVSHDTATNFANEIGATLTLTSAKEDKGIEDLFTKLSEEMYKMDEEEKEKKRIKLENQQKNKVADQNKKCC